jgi:hypothetical protein
MRIEVTPEADAFVREHGGRLYVWAAAALAAAAPGSSKPRRMRPGTRRGSLR